MNIGITASTRVPDAAVVKVNEASEIHVERRCYGQCSLSSIAINSLFLSLLQTTDIHSGIDKMNRRVGPTALHRTYLLNKSSFSLGQYLRSFTTATFCCALHPRRGTPIRGLKG